MTEQEAKQYKPGDKVIITCPGPSKYLIEEVVDVLPDTDPYLWRVRTTDQRYGTITWNEASSLCHRNPPARAVYTVISEDELSEPFPEHKPADAPRPLCPAEGEHETIDWEAHRRFMRGLG